MFVFYKAFISSMSEQCGLSIGSEMTSFNLQINGIRLKETNNHMNIAYIRYNHTSLFFQKKTYLDILYKVL